MENFLLIEAIFQYPKIKDTHLLQYNYSTNTKIFMIKMLPSLPCLNKNLIKIWSAQYLLFQQMGMQCKLTQTHHSTTFFCCLIQDWGLNFKRLRDIMDTRRNYFTLFTKLRDSLWSVAGFNLWIYCKKRKHREA